jgi:hypothetical protein
MLSSCCLVACVFVYSPLSTLNSWNNFHESWYVYHGTWSHLNDILHKSLLSGCMSSCVSPWQQLGKNVTVTTKTTQKSKNCEHVFCVVRVLSKENRPWLQRQALTHNRPDLSSERAPNKRQDRNFKKKISGQMSHIWARQQDILTDWPSVAMWLWLWLW